MELRSKGHPLAARSARFDPLQLYDAEFFQSLHEETRLSAAAVVPLVIELFQPKSVVDVGCGTGLWLSAFRERGVTDVFGIDGSWVESTRLEIPKTLFREYDLTRPVELDRTFDLAICLEVAEHLPSDVGQLLVGSLTRLAPVILFSAAIPFQGGSGHINERWPSYWSDLFAACGYATFTDLRHRIWKNNNIAVWYRQNMLCFVAQQRIDVVSLSSRGTSEPLDIVHPDLYLSRACELERLERQLSRIKESGLWRLYRALRPIVVAVSVVSSRLRSLCSNGI
jgi:SAM-dependent methyltransferase